MINQNRKLLWHYMDTKMCLKCCGKARPLSSSILPFVKTHQTDVIKCNSLCATICCWTEIKMEGEMTVLYSDLKICVNFSYFIFFPNQWRWGQGLWPLTLEFEGVCREKSEKEINVAIVKLLHWTDSSALLETSCVRYRIFLKNLLWI